jgi:hypothetical protein
MNLVMPRAINCEFITLLSKTKSSLISDMNYAGLRPLRKKLEQKMSLMLDLEMQLVDFISPIARITSSVRYYRAIEPILESILLELKEAKRRMRSAERIKVIGVAVRGLEFRLTKLRELVQFIDPVHLAMQKHLLAFVTPLRSVSFAQEHLYRLIDARDEFFRTGEKNDLEAYLKTLEELTTVIVRDLRVAFKEQYEATAQELSELEVAAMLAFE